MTTLTYRTVTNSTVSNDVAQPWQGTLVVEGWNGLGKVVSTSLTLQSLVMVQTQLVNSLPTYVVASLAVGVTARFSAGMAFPPQIVSNHAVGDPVLLYPSFGIAAPFAVGQAHSGSLDLRGPIGRDNLLIDVRLDGAATVNFGGVTLTDPDLTINQSHAWADVVHQVQAYHAGAGNNVVHGTRFADAVVLDAGHDRFLGGGGHDLADGHLGRDTMSGGFGDDTLIGGPGDDVLTGDDGDDRLSGGSDHDVMGGGLGRDTLMGGAGDDSLHGSAGDDALSGDDGRDTLTGGLGNDTLNGGAGNDDLSGGAWNDRLVGAGGDDTLSGELGRDTLIGGNGTDRFVFRAAGESVPGGDRDVIIGFQRGTDLVDLRQIDADSGAAGDQAFAFTLTRAAAHSVWFVIEEDRLVVAADVTGDAKADLQIDLGPHAGIGPGDFLL